MIFLSLLNPKYKITKNSFTTPQWIEKEGIKDGWSRDLGFASNLFYLPC